MKLEVFFRCLELENKATHNCAELFSISWQSNFFLLMPSPQKKKKKLLWPQLYLQFWQLLGALRFNFAKLTRY